MVVLDIEFEDIKIVTALLECNHTFLCFWRLLIAPWLSPGIVDLLPVLSFEHVKLVIFPTFRGVILVAANTITIIFCLRSLVCLCLHHVHFVTFGPPTP